MLNILLSISKGKPFAFRGQCKIFARYCKGKKTEARSRKEVIGEDIKVTAASNVY